jgi:hypothetical protein
MALAAKTIWHPGGESGPVGDVELAPETSSAPVQHGFDAGR